jgi:putative endonuclease
MTHEDPRHRLGKDGEDIACAELDRLGYEILARRHRTRYGEIDIIARDAGTTVFVEVKTRDGSDFGSGVEAVTPWKQQRIARMAIDYAARHGLLDAPCRVDVVDVALGAGAPRIEVYRNAFDVRVT